MILGKISLRQIFDSRGDPTLEIELVDKKKRKFIASVPSGKSRGSNEASVISHKRASTVLKKYLAGKLIGRNFKSVRDFDEALLSVDSTPRKTIIGGNLALGLSIAATRSLAASQEILVWQLLKKEFFPRTKISRQTPFLFSNLINGGEHANNNLSFQEYLVIAHPTVNPGESIAALVEIYRKLGKFLSTKLKIRDLPLGDENGYAPKFRNSFEPIEVLENLIKRNKSSVKLSLGIDSAATSFKNKNGYVLDGRKLTRSALIKKYLDLFKNSRFLLSVEDPFSEKDLLGFKTLTELLKGKMIVGDDLTTTNAELIAKYSALKLINACIIKPNQIGTITESCAAIEIAKKMGVKTIVSHRSGETEDVFIVHLAKASGAYGLKIGAPVKERMIKFNEIIRLYAQD